MFKKIFWSLVVCAVVVLGYIYYPKISAVVAGAWKGAAAASAECREEKVSGIVYRASVRQGAALVFMLRGNSSQVFSLSSPTDNDLLTCHGDSVEFYVTKCQSLAVAPLPLSASASASAPAPVIPAAVENVTVKNFVNLTVERQSDR